MKNVTTL